MNERPAADGGPQQLDLLSEAVGMGLDGARRRTALVVQPQ